MPAPGGHTARMKHLAILALFLTTACATGRVHFPPTDPSLPFSEAVLVDGTLYIAGHLGLDPETQRAPSDSTEEARLLLDSFSATLEQAGMSTADVVSVTLFCSDVGLYSTFNDVYREYFDAPYPARAFIGSGTLLLGARFEMKGIARK